MAKEVTETKAVADGLASSNQEQKGDEATTIKAEVQDSALLSIYFLPLKELVLFPFSLSPLVVDGEAMIAAMEKVIASNRILGLFSELNENGQIKGDLDLNGVGSSVQGVSIGDKTYSQIGVLARIVKMLRFPDGSIRILLRGLKRIKFVKTLVDTHPYFINAIEIMDDKDNSLETVAMAKSAISQFHEIITSSPFYPDDLRIAVMNVNDNSRLADLIADTLNFSFMEKLAILSSLTLHSRFQLLTILLNREIEILHLGSKIHSQVNNTMGQAQREYYLREQLRTIKKELGEDVRNPDIVALSEKFSKKELPPKVKELVDKELERLQIIPQISAEYNVSHTYLSWIADLPWGEFTEDSIDISEAARILDHDHYDLKDVKERILDFLAVLQLKKKSERKSPILCFIGPPGVGKTSLGQSIARAMKRNFVRMSLGGVRDEAEIRGHRRTYVGSLPGRIIQGIKKAKSSNPVFMLDEIDKIGADFRGDPAAALLEVLDPAQNNSFNDHYLEVDFDLSSVLFIATANISDTIPHALLDRMEIIHLPGYTAIEKIKIAHNYLIPRQLKDNGLADNRLIFPVLTVTKLIRDYTLEAGVRNLERTIGSICRKFAREIVEKKRKIKGRTEIKNSDLSKYLGPRKFFADIVEGKGAPGIVTGMAWTSAGGAIMPIEIRRMPGKGAIKMTGSLGDIMKESAEIAFSYIKSCHNELKLPKDVFTKSDFHVHVPDGATPKDGPSAGITVLVAIISLLKGETVNPRLAMTGEINLQGMISPVGGIREKVIAALAAGVEEIILPEKNKSDLEKVPEEVKEKIKFKFFSDIMNAAQYAMGTENKKKRNKK